MIEPEERLLWAVVGVAVVGAFGLAVPAIGGAAPWALGALACFVVVDAVLAGSPGRVRVRRVVPERLVEQRTVDVGVVVESDRRVDVTITDTLPGVDAPWLTLSAVVEPGEVVTLLAPRAFLRRGHHTAGRLAIRTRGPLGLVRRRQRRVVDDDYAVAVDLALVMKKAERLVRGPESAGGRKKRAIERGRELESLREYRRGDDVRLVDWKATAKKGDLVVKELVPETRQDVVVVVDAGRQLLGLDDAPPVSQPDGQVAGRPGPRFDVALQAALVLCAAALAKGDRCGLAVLQDEVVRWVPPHHGSGASSGAGGKAALKRVADAVVDVVALAIEPAWQLLPGFLARHLKRRALVVIVTDVVDEASARAVAHATAALRGRHLVVVVALGDPGLSRLARGAPTAQVGGEADRTRPDPAHSDPLSALLPKAATRLLQHRKRALKALEAAGAVVVDAPSPKAAALAVDAYLALKLAGRL